MSVRAIQALELVFAICAVFGFAIYGWSYWAAWFCCFLFFILYAWRCLKIGVVYTGYSTKWYGFTFNRETSPELFYCGVGVQLILALASLIMFLCSF